MAKKKVQNPEEQELLQTTEVAPADTEQELQGASQMPEAPPVGPSKPDSSTEISDSAEALAEKGVETLPTEPEESASVPEESGEIEPEEPEAVESAGGTPAAAEVMDVNLTQSVEKPPVPEADEAQRAAWVDQEKAPATAPPEAAPTPEQPRKDDRQMFYELDFHELDRELTTEERQEWNSIYASYRGRSAITGRIIGVDPHSIQIRNRQTGKLERQTMYCAIVVPYRVRIVIPASEMWEAGHERPDFVLQNMVGANINFIIIKVDRETGFAIGSRRLACRARRHFFTNRPALQRKGTMLKCNVLSVGPRRCLVECYGHDINLTQRDLRYTAIPDLRQEYHPGEELECVVKGYDPAEEALTISVKETQSNPFDGAELRHPVGSRRQAVIAGKYGGGVFCNLPDGTVCMCNYAYQHEDSAFMVGDTVILAVQRFEKAKKQMYGKILTKW